MGRQLHIGTTDRDIISIINFLKDRFNCILYRSFSLTQEQLIINDSKPIIAKFSTQIHIWNTNFNWQPIIKQTNTKDKLYYIENKSIGPIIQFSNSNWDPFEPGRIYWNKTIDPAFDYDINEFEKFYNELASWIRKNSIGLEKRSYGNIYFLDGAWKQYKKVN